MLRSCAAAPTVNNPCTAFDRCAPLSLQFPLPFSHAWRQRLIAEKCRKNFFPAQFGLELLVSVFPTIKGSIFPFRNEQFFVLSF